MKRYIRSAVGLQDYESFLQNNDYEGLLRACVKEYNKQSDDSSIQLTNNSYKYTVSDGPSMYGELSDYISNFIDVINDPHNDYLDFSDPFYWSEAAGVALPPEGYSTASTRSDAYLDDKYSFTRESKSDFYSVNMPIFIEVFKIASCGARLDETLLHWANSTSSIEGTIRVMVQCKKDEVFIKGAPYGTGLPGIILKGAWLAGFHQKLYPRQASAGVDHVKNDFTKSEQQYYPEATKFVLDKIDDILDYLQSRGIDCEYLDRRHYIVCKKSTFPG